MGEQLTVVVQGQLLEKWKPLEFSKEALQQ
jgi:hypothetical protein